MLQIYSLKESKHNQTQKLWHVEVWYTLPCRGGVFPPWGPSSSSLRSKGLRRVWRKLASLSPYSIVLSTSVYKMSLFYWSETDTVVLTSTSPHDSQVLKKYKSRVRKLIFFFKISGNQHKFGRFQTINVCSCFLFIKAVMGQN